MSFAIVILEVNDMNIDDNRPGMPGFYENTNPGDTRYKNVALVSAKQNYEYVRSQSVGGERIRASVSRRQVTPSVLERVKGAIFQFVDIAQYCVTEVLHQPLRAVAVAGILAALGLGANAINQEVIQPSVIEYQAYSNDVNQQIEQIINDKELENLLRINGLEVFYSNMLTAQERTRAYLNICLELSNSVSKRPQMTSCTKSYKFRPSLL